jgi:hypothetical protein
MPMLNAPGCSAEKWLQVLHAMGFSANTWRSQYRDTTKSYFLNAEGSGFLPIDGALP